MEKFTYIHNNLWKLFGDQFPKFISLFRYQNLKNCNLLYSQCTSFSAYYWMKLSMASSIMSFKWILFALFFLLFIHILNTQLHSIYLNQKNSLSQFLTKFFFGCKIDKQKISKKNLREPASLKVDKQLNAFLRSFKRTLLIFMTYVCSPEGHWFAIWKL